MTRTEIIELMAEAIDAHFKRAGLIGSYAIPLTFLKNIFDALTAAGLAIVPIEPSETMIEAAYQSSFAGNDDNKSVYRAMITAALKESEE